MPLKRENHRKSRLAPFPSFRGHPSPSFGQINGARIFMLTTFLLFGALIFPTLVSMEGHFAILWGILHKAYGFHIITYYEKLFEGHDQFHSAWESRGYFTYLNTERIEI